MLVSGGAHDLSFSIDAHITIAGTVSTSALHCIALQYGSEVLSPLIISFLALGGTLLWPFSRGSHQTISFNGGLLLKETGRLIVEPYSTRIDIFAEVILMDNWCT